MRRSSARRKLSRVWCAAADALQPHDDVRRAQRRTPAPAHLAGRHGPLLRAHEVDVDVVHAVTWRGCFDDQPLVAAEELVENARRAPRPDGPPRDRSAKVGSLQERSVGMYSRAKRSGSPCSRESRRRRGTRDGATRRARDADRRDRPALAGSRRGAVNSSIGAVDLREVGRAHTPLSVIMPSLGKLPPKRVEGVEHAHPAGVAEIAALLVDAEIEEHEPARR